MQPERTMNGARFQYKRHPDGEIIVYPEQDGMLQDRSAIVITPYTIRLVQEAIRAQKTLLMGASRDRPAQGSLGALLKHQKQSPQQLSYLVPILVAEGFCTCSKDGQGYTVHCPGG